MTQEKKDKTISGVSTALIMLFSVLLCSWIGYKIPNPPIPEEGMGVAGEVLGEVEGLGNNDNATTNDNNAAAPSAAPSESYTTGSEPTPVAKTPKNEENNTPVQKPDPNKVTEDNSNASQNQNSTPATNPNATFQGRRNNGGSEGKGLASGSGQAGSADGTVGANGGNGRGGGSGYSLGGRTLRGNLPRPAYTSSKDGDVVVRIKVDKSGTVVEVDAPYKGSKNYDQAMVQAAKQAALNAKFNADPNATEYQYGSITYMFRRQG